MCEKGEIINHRVNDFSQETIAAVSTPSGTGGIAVVRVSGPEALCVVDRVVRLRRRKPVRDLDTWSAALGDAYGADAVFLDEVVVMVMRAPNSYTGEDVVEIQCHGGRLVTEKILDEVLRLGVRAAMPGEFTRRAYLSGRINLLEAEAVADVVAARSEAALVQAGRRLKGEFGGLVRSWEERLVGLLSTLLGSSDFPEDVSMERDGLTVGVESLFWEMDTFLSRAPIGLALAEGVQVCLVGKPNVGKSSLFNALLREDRAIVTEIPGTTRDILREHSQWEGVPVVLLDTAGLRATAEIVEVIGVERAESAASTSEVILYVVEDTAGLTPEDRGWLERWKERRLLLVINKVDAGAGLITPEVVEPLVGNSAVWVSCLTGQGLEDLRKKVAGWFSSKETLDQVVPGSARQVDCVRRAACCLKDALDEINRGWPDDVVVFSLEDAAKALKELTGTDWTEEALNQVFERFCVGK